MESIPVPFATAFLLHLLWISVDVARFGKVARKMFLGSGSPVSEAGVVSIVVFLSTSH